MAKGSQSKEIVFNKLLEVFEGSFMYNNGKELRISMEENGDIVQIKVTLTAAKDIIESDAAGVSFTTGAAAFPSPKKKSVIDNGEPSQVTKNVEPTDEEKHNIESLMAALGLN